jgi:hypothetical protein
MRVWVASLYKVFKYSLASLLSRRAVHFPAFSAERDRRMRVGRNPFGGIFLHLPLNSIADAVPNGA